MRVACSWVQTNGPLGRLRVERRGGRLWSVAAAGEDDPGDAAPADRELGDWFAGTVRGFGCTLAERGTVFQREVWAATREIPFGETVSYGELAARVGRPKASRAVGAALGANPWLVVVPCHRVVGADGSLTGFARGEEAKRWLLEHERGEPAGGSTLFGDG